MVDRIGDWYAFSSASYCRSTIVYDSMAWESGFELRTREKTTESFADDVASASPQPFLTLAPSFSFQAYCGGAAAPFGGLVALIRAADSGAAPFGAVGAGSPGSSSSYGYGIDVFTTAGEYRTTFGVPKGDGEVCGMEWTMEGVELCVLTALYECLVFDVGNAAPSAGLLSPPSSWSPCARKVSLGKESTSKAAPVDDTAPGAAMVCFALTPRSVSCVGADRRLHGLLHVERGRSQVLASVGLPRITSNTPSTNASSARSFCATAVALLPESANDTGETIAFWSQSAVYAEERVVSADDDHQLCAMTLSDVTGAPEGTPNTLPLRARVHQLQLCPHDPTRLLVFTARGTLHVITSDLQRQLFSMDFALTTAADIVPHLVSSSFCHNPLDNASLSAPHNLSLMNNAPLLVADDNGTRTAASPTHEAVGAPFGCRGVGAVATAATTTLPVASWHASSFADLLPTAITWCGPHFLLLHYGNWRAASDGVGDDDGDETPCFSLLTCLHASATVRCVRLDWSLEGASGRVLCSSEVDGARVVAEGRCVMLHEVPPSLVELCRLSEPYGSSARVVLAFEEYIQGGYQGLAHARSALLEADAWQDDDHAPPAEVVLARARKTFFALVDAASWEWDAERQKRLLSAASFAHTMCHFPMGSEVLVDVMTRLRLLRAIRDESRCHMPLTALQYRVLNGDWSALRLERRYADLDADNDIDLAASDDDSQHHHAHSDDDVDSSSADAETEAEQWRLDKNEARILVDRLVALGHFRLALEVSSAVGGRSTRVVTYWAQEQVRRADASTPTQELASRIDQVLSSVPDSSYIEAASEALAQRRVDLAQQLLQNEPRADKKVELLLQYGAFSAAARCAADSADANLLSLALNALVRQVLTRAVNPSDAMGVADASDHASARMAALAPPDCTELASLWHSCPAATHFFTTGAGFVHEWRQLLAALNTSNVIPSSAIGYKHLEDCLWGHDARQMAQLAQDLALFLRPRDPLVADLSDGEEDGGREGKKSKKSKKQRGITPSSETGLESAADESAAALPAREGEVYTLPPVAAAKPSTSDVCAALGSTELDAIVEALGASTATARRRREASDVSAATAVAHDASWLARQRDLETVKEQLVERYHDGRFFTAASVVDVIKLLYAHNASDYVAKLGNLFNVPERTRLFACLEVLCESGQWERVDDFLGPPPPLRKSGFFSRSGTDNRGSAAPTLGYVAVVETLLRYHQDERAAEFIPGVTEDAVERVQWYMSLRAPVMAMEAAYVAGDPGLLEQILAKVPITQTRVIEKGQALLQQLAREM